MRMLVTDVGLDPVIELDSAGTGAWHAGEPPDRRATETAQRYGVTLTGRARQVVEEDFDRFDLIIAADMTNYRDLMRTCPEEASGRVVRFADYAGLDVPDPYYGGPDGFDETFRIVRSGCVELLAQLRTQLPG